MPLGALVDEPGQLAGKAVRPEARLEIRADLVDREGPDHDLLAVLVHPGPEGGAGGFQLGGRKLPRTSSRCRAARFPR